MGTDVFSYHGYVEVWLDEKWIKVTPVFNIELCEKVGVAVQEFDGENDSLFQEFDRAGRRHMEYLLDRGVYRRPFRRDHERLRRAVSLFVRRCR